jgi:hypothetical protein
VHIERQNKMGLDAWWDKYLADVEFRYIEELVAHQAEYATYCKRHLNPVKRTQFLRRIAQRLASPLYATGSLVANAMLAIQYPAAPGSAHEIKEAA